MAGRRIWTQETLSVPDMQEYLQDQVVMAFTNGSQRTAQVPDPTPGMVTYLEDLDALHVRTPAGAWRDIGAQPRAQLYARAADVGSGLAAGYFTLLLGGETSDTHGGHAAGASGYTVPAGRGGVWRVSGLVALGAATAGAMCGGRFQVNGGQTVANPPVLMPAGNAAGSTVPLPPVELTLNAGDVVTMQGYVAVAGWSYSGSDIAGGATCRMNLERIAA